MATTGLTQSSMSRPGGAEVNTMQRIASSCTGATITSIFVTPLDVVKIRMQAQQKEFMKNKCFLYCNGLMDHVCYCFNNGKGKICQIHGKKSFKNSHSYHSISVKHLTDNVNSKDFWYRRPTQFNGTLDGLIKIARNEGITSLWSGLPPTLVMALPATVMYFTIYDSVCAKLRYHCAKRPNSEFWIPSLSGGISRIVAASMISPLEMIRTKMQSKKLSYLQVGTAIRQTVKAEGIFSMWTGLTATLLRDVPFSCIYWFSYETLKRSFDQRHPSFWFSFAAGGFSGSVAAVITLPFDVVKTHRQIELGELELLKDKSNPRRMGEIMRYIYRERGIRGLFTGISPRLIKVAPACAFMISTYESGKGFFRKLNSESSQ